MEYIDAETIAEIAKVNKGQTDAEALAEKVQRLMAKPKEIDVDALTDAELAALKAELDDREKPGHKRLDPVRLSSKASAWGHTFRSNKGQPKTLCECGEVKARKGRCLKCSRDARAIGVRIQDMRGGKVASLAMVPKKHRRAGNNGPTG